MPALIERIYNLALNLPAFGGKARLESYLRSRLLPKPFKIPSGIAMELNPGNGLNRAKKMGCLEPKTAALFEIPT